MKCTVAGGHELSDRGQNLGYGDTITVQKSAIEGSELEEAVLNGQLVVESRQTYQQHTDEETTSSRFEAGRGESTSNSSEQPTPSSSEQEPQEIRVEAPSVDLSSLEELLATQNELLRDVLDELRSQEAASGMDVNGLLDKLDGDETGGAALDESGPEYVPSDIRSGETEVSNPPDADESETSSGGIDEAAEALESMKEGNDE